eukprot:scaffold4840_cov115-Isochrysis_galbana.AAC.15
MDPSIGPHRFCPMSGSVPHARARHHACIRAHLDEIGCAINRVADPKPVRSGRVHGGVQRGSRSLGARLDRLLAEEAVRREGLGHGLLDQPLHLPIHLSAAHSRRGRQVEVMKKRGHEPRWTSTRVAAGGPITAATAGAPTSVSRSPLVALVLSTSAPSRFRTTSAAARPACSATRSTSAADTAAPSGPASAAEAMRTT